MLLDFGLLGTIVLLVSLLLIFRMRAKIVKEHLDVYVALFLLFSLFRKSNTTNSFCFMSK